MPEKALQNILENKIKSKIAAFFLANPDRAFFSGDLEKQIGSRSIASHLNAMVKSDLLRSFNKKGKRYFIANKKNPIWAQIKGPLFKLTKKYDDELVKSLKRIKNLKVAVLTGLFTANPEMQCDVLLVGNVSKRGLDGFIKIAEKLAGQEVNFALFDAEEYLYRRSIFDRFMKDIFENPHILVSSKIR